MEREVWHIFYLKVTSLIAIIVLLIATMVMAITFGNYYAFYETQYSVRFELHEIHRQYWSQYIYICYLGSILACDLIACLAILYNLNYIILFAVFHHLTLLSVKIYSGFELNIPGEHSEAILILFLVLHMVIIISLSLLYRKLDSVLVLKEILVKELNEKEQEKRRLKDRNNLNVRLINEYQQKFVTNDDKSARSDSFRSIGRDSNRNVELEPMSVDVDNDFDTIKHKFNNHQNAHNDLKSNRSNGYRNRMQEDYDSDGYLKVNSSNLPSYDKPVKVQLIKNQLTNSEDRILDHLNKQNDFSKNFDNESDVVYLDDGYVDNDYDYLRCNIDEQCENDENEHIYAQIMPKSMQINSQIIQPTDPTNKSKIESAISLKTENKKGIHYKRNDPNNKKLIHKSVQTNQSINEPDTLDSNFHTSTDAIKESTRQSNSIKSRKIEYSTLKYDHKIFYESSV